MKTKLSKTTHRLIIAIISLLGFSITSCEPELMYGPAYSDYRPEDSVMVEDEEITSNPAEEIAVEE